MSANFWFATAKLLHFSELRKKNLPKSKVLLVFSCFYAIFSLPLQRIHQYKWIKEKN